MNIRDNATGADGLIGTWKLVSWQVIVEHEPPQDLFGAHPKGYLILTPQGRSIVVTTAENRRGGMGDDERAALHESMVAYSGKYRVEGNDFVTVVDVSWNEEWNGTEQRRRFRIDGDKLFIEFGTGAEYPVSREDRFSQDCLGAREVVGSLISSQASPHNATQVIAHEAIWRRDLATPNEFVETFVDRVKNLVETSGFEPPTS